MKNNALVSTGPAMALKEDGYVVDVVVSQGTRTTAKHRVVKSEIKIYFNFDCHDPK